MADQAEIMREIKIWTSAFGQPASPCVYVFQELCHVKNAIEVNEGKRRGMQTSDCHENDRTFFYSFVLASVSMVY